MQANTLNKKNRKVGYLFCTLLLLFSIEYLGEGGLSVYRLLIFPISFLIILNSDLSKLGAYKRVISFFVLYLIWEMLCQILKGDSPMGPLFTIPLVVAIVCVWSLRCEIDYAKIFLLYTIPHLAAILLGLDFMNGTRFCGLHTDPNFCGLYISTSLVSSFLLVSRNNVSKKYKVFCFIIGVISLFLLLATASRGAIVSFLFLAAFYLFTTKISIITKLLIIVSLVVFSFYLWSYILSLPNWVNPEDSFIDSVLCRFNPENMEGGSGRSDIWETVISRLLASNLITPIGLATAMKGLPNGYAHNTYIEIMVEDGVIGGLLFITAIFIALVKAIRLKIHKRVDGYTNDLFFLIFVLLSQMFFISAGIKIFWLIVVSLFCLNNHYSFLRKRKYNDL